MIFYNEDRVVTKIDMGWYKYLYRLWGMIYTNKDGRRLRSYHLYRLGISRGGMYDVRG